MSDKSERFEEWEEKFWQENRRYCNRDDIWNYQQKKIDELEKRIKDFTEGQNDAGIEYKRMQQKLRAAEEEIFLLRMIAYAYKSLDCHSSPEAIDAITVKGWQAQLNYEKWWLNNKGDVHFKDWKELEQALEKARKE